MSRKDAATHFYINFVTTVVYLSFLLNSTIAVKPRGFSLKMIRSDSKESPLYRGDHLTEAERLERLVRQSKARAHYYGSKASSHNKSSMDPDMIRLPAAFAHDRYHLVHVGIGSFRNQPQPFNDYYLIMDTGSDLTWIQCQGGTSYFYQDSPLFPYQDSHTYQRIPCYIPGVCDEEHCNDEGYCMYNVGYVSGPTTSGDLAIEKFTTASSAGEEVVETVNLVMGCGFEQKKFGRNFGVPDIVDGHQLPPQPLPQPGSALVAGVLGLGQGDFTSLVRQLVDSEGKFSYCLESYDSPAVAGSHTYLRFGADATIEGGPEAVHTTPLYQNPNFGTPYYLHLEDISIGDRKLKFAHQDFKIKPNGSGGTIIDSGAPLSTMSWPHFERVREALVEHMEAEGALYDAAPHTYLDPCFEIPPTFDPNKFPTMTFHFQQADYVLDKVSDIFFSNEDGSLLCFNILGLDGDTYDFTLGAMQQANKRILYDVRGESLSFTKANCQMGA